MSYNIGIGEAQIVYITQDYKDYEPLTYCYIQAIGAKRDDAPNLGDASKNGNYRYPSALQFLDFCNKSGLYELFLNKEYGLLRNNFGAVPIIKDHLRQITEARERYEKKYPEEVKRGLQPTGLYGRLVWYEFWFKWALENCKMPVISIS